MQICTRQIKKSMTYKKICIKNKIYLIKDFLCDILIKKYMFIYFNYKGGIIYECVIDKSENRVV